jgi:hypothetical protein
MMERVNLKLNRSVHFATAESSCMRSQHGVTSAHDLLDSVVTRVPTLLHSIPP